MTVRSDCNVVGTEQEHRSALGYPGHISGPKRGNLGAAMKAQLIYFLTSISFHLNNSQRYDPLSQLTLIENVILD